MMKLTMNATLGMAVLAMAGTSMAGQIQMDPNGGGPILNSGPLSGFAFGGPGQPVWTSSVLKLVHDHIDTNSTGITTDGKITIIAADTDHGLALMTLIDRGDYRSRRQRCEARFGP